MTVSLNTCHRRTICSTPPLRLPGSGPTPSTTAEDGDITAIEPDPLDVRPGPRPSAVPLYQTVF
jgi:hypothetical protein